MEKGWAEDCFATILDRDINLDKMLLSYVNSLAFVGWWAFAWAYSRDERARETTRAHAREKSNLRFQRSGVSKPTTTKPYLPRRRLIQKAENPRINGRKCSIDLSDLKRLGINFWNFEIHLIISDLTIIFWHRMEDYLSSRSLWISFRR